MVSTYPLFATSFAVVAVLDTVALVKAAVDGVVLPIVVLFMLVLISGKDKPEVDNVPLLTLSI